MSSDCSPDICRSRVETVYEVDNFALRHQVDIKRNSTEVC